MRGWRHVPALLATLLTLLFISVPTQACGCAGEVVTPWRTYASFSVLAGVVAVTGWVLCRLVQTRAGGAN